MTCVFERTKRMIVLPKVLDSRTDKVTSCPGQFFLWMDRAGEGGCEWCTLRPTFADLAREFALGAVRGLSVVVTRLGFLIALLEAALGMAPLRSTRARAEGALACNCGVKRRPANRQDSTD